MKLVTFLTAAMIAELATLAALIGRIFRVFAVAVLLAVVCSCQSEQLNFSGAPVPLTLTWTDTNIAAQSIALFPVDTLQPPTPNYATSTNWQRAITVPATNSQTLVAWTNNLTGPYLVTVFAVSSNGVSSVPAVPVLWTNPPTPATPANLTAQ
jgi:hypothetical protein